MVQHLCNDASMLLLDTCGDHANPRHFHEYLSTCLSSKDGATGHSTRLGTAGDDRGIYGMWESDTTCEAVRCPNPRGRTKHATRSA